MSKVKIEADGATAVVPKHIAETYEVLGYRQPKKGEWYLSGAKVEAWEAPNNLSHKYFVVRKK